MRSTKRCPPTTLGYLAEARAVEDVVVAEARNPSLELRPQSVQENRALLQRDPVSLTVVDADRLDAAVALERVGQVCRRTLAAQELAEGGSFTRHAVCSFAVQHIACGPPPLV
jgi:hypothetical protein